VASSSRKTTPVSGFTFPSPPTPPSKAFEFMGVTKRENVAAVVAFIVADINSERVLCFFVRLITFCVVLGVGCMFVMNNNDFSWNSALLGEKASADAIK